MELKEKFEAGDFAILAEMEPPKGVDISPMLENAKKVKGMVDAFVVPEMSNAVMRLSALGGSMILQANGFQTVMQVCCRDRNRLALQADLLAAYACGIKNIMAVSGEDPSFGDHHKAKAVYDIDLLEMLKAVQKLQTGTDMAGVDLLGTPSFLVGSTANAGAKDQGLELEIEEMNKKIDEGTTFFITPPLFDISSIEPFMKRVDRSKTIIIPTVLLLKSVGMARYIDRNLDNVHLPGTIIERIMKSPDKARECVSIANEIVSALKQEGFNGVLLSTIGWEKRLPDILKGI
ncbi:MAG: methylenetetrahydrofolate reductase [Deltaproteobacteria bacterium]|nr:methylenetetrahydrofolate reductase [Deltaproteobacteria bacterium]MBW2180527.1 methylenetetrahydrofolate reductase [Deltaproteobacteria bacterium]